MAIALVQSASAAAPSCAYGSANTAGNLLVAVLQDSNDPAGITLSDTRGNAWIKAVGLYSSGLVLSGSIWYAANCAAGANTVAVAGGFTVFQCLAVAEYSGIATASPLDKTAVDLNSAAASPDSGPTAATTQADELLVGGIALDAGSAVTWTGSFTSRQSATNGGGNRMVAFGDRIVSTTGAYDATATSTTGDWIAAIATFKAASAPSGGPFPFFLDNALSGGFNPMGI